MITHYFDTLDIPSLTFFMAVILFFVLTALLVIARKLNRIVKDRGKEKLVERVKLLEQELEHYMVRSQRRLEIFRHVIDGFDHVIQGVRGVMDEEEQANLTSAFEGRLHKELLEEEREAEVIRIDKD